MLLRGIQKVVNSVNSTVNEKLIDVQQKIAQLEQKVIEGEMVEGLFDMTAKSPQIVLEGGPSSSQ